MCAIEIQFQIGRLNIQYRSTVEKLPFVKLVFPLEDLLMRNLASNFIEKLSFCIIIFRRPSCLATILTALP